MTMHGVVIEQFMFSVGYEKVMRSPVSEVKVPISPKISTNSEVQIENF